MTPKAERAYWRATAALAEAETLARLRDNVSGPADEPPRGDGDEAGWIDDWTSRASETLKKAKAWTTSKKKTLVERGARIARRVREGARKIYEASPLARANQKLVGLIGDAQKIQLAGEAVAVVATVVLGYVAYRLFIKKG